jgi:tetratricopeptide (TPR) repeat protein
MNYRFHGAFSAAALMLAALAALAQLNPQAELASRMRAAAAAQQHGEPAAIAQANRHLAAFALSQIAELHESENDAAAAADLYAQSLSLEDAADLRYRCALAFMSAGKIDAALHQTAVLVEQEPRNAAFWSLQGKLQMTDRKFGEAAESFQKSLSLQSDPETAYVLATAFINLHQTEKAQKIFNRLQQAGVSAARIHVMAGRAYEDAGLPEEAEREYKQAIELDPKSHGHYYLGLFYYSRNGWEPTPKARAEFAGEVAANPDDFFGNYFLGYLASIDKDYATSDRYLKVAAAAKPDWPEPFLYLGLNAYGRGDNAAAEEYLRKAMELTPDERRNNYQIRRAYFTLGRILIQGGRKEEGTRLVEGSKQMETKLVLESRKPRVAVDERAAPLETNAQSGVQPVAPDKSTNLTESQKSQIATAEKALAAIVGNAYNDLGTSEARQNDYATALAHFEDAERWNPESAGLERNIALAAFLSGSYQQSARRLRALLEHDGSDRHLQSMLAMSLYMLKQYPEAAKAFDQASDEALADPRMTVAWADTLVQTKDAEHANQLLGKLSEQSLPPQMLVRMGELYSNLGDRSNAEKCFEKAKAQDPSVEVPR